MHILYVLFMALLWSIAAFLSSATAKPIAKFLCSRLESYLKGKNVSALASKDTSKLNGQFNELKMINDSLQNAPPNEPAPDKLVEDLGKNIVQLEDFQRKKKLSEPLFSRELFESWIENEPIEDRAYVAHNRLDLIIDWCIKNKVRETKRWQLEQVSNNLAMFTSNLRKARENLQGNPGYIPYQQQVMEAEIALRANLSTAKALFAEYSSYGG
jgi:hypothetical protein